MRVLSRIKEKREAYGENADADANDCARDNIEANEASRPATECHGERLL